MQHQRLGPGRNCDPLAATTHFHLSVDSVPTLSEASASYSIPPIVADSEGGLGGAVDDALIAMALIGRDSAVAGTADSGLETC